MIIEPLGSTLANKLLSLEKLVSVMLCEFGYFLSLTGSAFSWFSSLAPNSIHAWN
jgi:hypothetical protein